MKFGGSSVANPEKIKHVAQRLAAAKESGRHVVGTVSAMGKTTDGLLELAHQVSPTPDGRELDMLLSTGERISCALVASRLAHGLPGRDPHRRRPHEGEDHGHPR
jgi:aspartate kinase